MNERFVIENPGALAEGMQACLRIKAGLHALMTMAIVADKGGDRRGGNAGSKDFYSKTSAKEEKWQKN